MENNIVHEFDARTRDLQRINAIYGDETAESYDDLRRELLEDVEARNQEFLVKLTNDGFEMLDAIPSVNRNWQDAIFRLALRAAATQAALKDELQQRTNELEAVINALTGKGTTKEVGDASIAAKERHDQQADRAQQIAQVEGREEPSHQDMDMMADNERWEDLLRQAERVPAHVDSAALAGDFAPLLTKTLMDELAGRVQDLEKLKKTPQDQIPDLVKQAEERQDRLEGILAEAAEQGTDEEIDARAEVWDQVSNDNKHWINALGDADGGATPATGGGAAGGAAPAGAAAGNAGRAAAGGDGGDSDKLRGQRDYAREEMQGRIEDLKRFKDLANQKEAGELDEEQMTEAVAELVTDIRERHKEIEANIGEQLTDQDLLETVKVLLQPEAISGDDGGDYAPDDPAEDEKDEKTGGPDASGEPQEVMMTQLDAYKQNDKDWRAAFEDLIRDVLKVEAPPEEPPKPAWWLDQDPERNALIDDIKVEAEEQKELDEDAVYLNRVLCIDDDEMRQLYIPFKLNDEEELDNHHILATLFDGRMVGMFLDLCEPEFIDSRVIHGPDLEEPFPLSNKQVEDNVQLAISSAKSLGIRLPSYNARDWMEPSRHTPILLAIIRELTAKHLEKYVNINDVPELVRLALDSEDSDAIAELGPYDWIPRWINRTLKRPLQTPIDNYNGDLYQVVGALNPDFIAKGPCRKFDENPEAAAEHLINYVRDEMGVDTDVQSEDLLSNNKKLQDLLAAQIFDMKSGIPKLTKKEQSRFKSIILDDSIATGDESMCNFINTMLDGMTVHNLTRDLSDGVVICKILEKVKPGCVNWKKVRDRGEIRHKFDKMNNCNQGMKAAKDIGLKMVGAGGQDLHEGNQKIIHSLLWQVMRFKAIETLNNLSIGDEKIEEADILDWANATLQELPAEERKTRPIRGFKDRQLTTCTFYCDLLKVLLPGAVNDEVVAYDVPPLQDLRRDYGDSEENTKSRLGNARYAMTLARREGAELFVLPEDLITLQPKAVLSMLASLMMIYFKEQREASADEQKVDDDITYELDGGKGFAG